MFIAFKDMAWNWTAGIQSLQHHCSVFVVFWPAHSFLRANSIEIDWTKKCVVFYKDVSPLNRGGFISSGTSDYKTFIRAPPASQTNPVSLSSRTRFIILRKGQLWLKQDGLEKVVLVWIFAKMSSVLSWCLIPSTCQAMVMCKGLGVFLKGLSIFQHCLCQRFSVFIFKGPNLIYLIQTRSKVWTRTDDLFYWICFQLRTKRKMAAVCLQLFA